VGCSLTYLNFLSFLLNRRKISEFMEILRKEDIELFPGLIELYHFLPLFGKTVELINPLENIDDWILR
jgi:hypothetical protein